MASNMYTEALAEAKQLREIAEKNAKNAIIEAVTPKIRQFIDDQLLETSGKKDVSRSSVDDIIAESIGIANSEDEGEVSLDNTALQSLAGLLGSSGTGGVLDALAESINSLDHDQAELVASAAKKIESTKSNFTQDRINKDVSNLQENNKMASREKVYEIDLNLLKEELGRDLSLNEETGDDDNRDTDDADEAVSAKDKAELKEMLADLGILSEAQVLLDLGDDVELPEDIQIVASLVEEEEGDEEDLELLDVEDDEGDVEVSMDVEEDLGLNEVFEIDPKVLKEELLRIRRLVREAKSLADAKGGANSMEASFGGKGHANAGQKNQFGGKGSGKGNPFGGGSEKGDIYKVKLNALAESLRKEQRKNRSLVTKLDEYRGAVETLREQLTDLNLFNAKLLYVNKLFQDKSVPPSRRRAMMESIDSAKSLREVKLVYKTLTESSRRKGSLNESATRSLGSSSRSVGRSSATSTNPELDRWALLAGIKK